MDSKLKTITLGELLNDKQIVEVTRILNSSADSMERVRRLKDYFDTFREDLEARGVEPHYLSYAVEYYTAAKRDLLAHLDELNIKV